SGCLSLCPRLGQRRAPVRLVVGQRDEPLRAGTRRIACEDGTLVGGPRRTLVGLTPTFRRLPSARLNRRLPTARFCRLGPGRRPRRLGPGGRLWARLCGRLRASRRGIGLAYPHEVAPPRRGGGGLPLGGAPQGCHGRGDVPAGDGP